jgi:TRAP transporter 4TM/12TM fusion protein
LAGDDRRAPEPSAHRDSETKITAVTSTNAHQSAFFKATTGAITVVGIATSLIYLYSAEFGLFPTSVQRGILLAAAFFIFFAKTAQAPSMASWNRAVHLLLAVAGVAVSLFFAFTHDEIALRPTGPNTIETSLGLLLIILVLDWTRREMGWGLPLLSLVFVAHAYLGPYLPGFISHRGLDAEYLIQYLAFEEEGIWGISLGVCATVIVVFVIFGAVLKATGVGEFLVDLSYAAFGRFRGGPAKMAVIGSALFGTVSGSAVANVVGTGTFTIPLMKRVGYRPEFAGAVEATASTGGQIMPPVMGAAAFIMAQVLGVPYSDVMIAALLPAILYYMSIFFAVDLEAARTGLKGLPRAQLPKFTTLLLERGYLLFPIAILIFLLVGLDWSPMKAAFWAILAAIAVGFVNPENRRDPWRLVRSLSEGMNDMTAVTASCACSGIFIGALTMTGLTLKMSAVLVDWSGGSLIILLVLTMLASLVLGMGLPTVACYIMLAILVAPALVTMGADPMAAHMFVFYFGIISAITPPVAMAAFAGAAIAGADQMRTGYVAMRIGLSAFILPFMFVMAPALMLKGPVEEILVAAVTAALGIWALTAGLIGYGLARLNLVERCMLFGASLALIFPGALTDALGLGVVAMIMGRQLWARRTQEGQSASRPVEAGSTKGGTS